MPTLVLELAGPLQAWGSGSRFVHRATEAMPTKSGVIGLLAAAKGIRRSEPLTELVGLKFGVRADQHGRRLTDFQTVHHQRTGESKPLTYRDYLTDAKFTVGLEGESSLLEGLAQAISSPVFPLYLGRRACPPSARLVLGVRDADLSEALRSEPWRAAEWYRRDQPQTVRLAISRDVKAGEIADGRVRDEPISFDQRHREYAWRKIRLEWLEVANPVGRRVLEHDALALLGGE